MWGTKSQDRVHRPQLLKRKESRSGIEPRSFRLPAYRLTARPNRLSTLTMQYSTAQYVLSRRISEIISPSRFVIPPQSRGVNRWQQFGLLKLLTNSVSKDTFLCLREVQPIHFVNEPSRTVDDRVPTIPVPVMIIAALLTTTTTTLPVKERASDKSYGFAGCS